MKRLLVTGATGALGSEVVHVAAAWLAIRGDRRPILPIPTFDALSRAWRSGTNLVPGNSYGEIRWEEWLREKYGR